MSSALVLIQTMAFAFAACAIVGLIGLLFHWITRPPVVTLKPKDQRDEASLCSDYVAPAERDAPHCIGHRGIS